MMTPITAWKFLAPSRRLGHGDGRRVSVGTALEVEGSPSLCHWGLHASRRAIDALQYAESPWLARVVCEGDLVEGDDKIACTKMTPLAIFDATATLRHFARLCALDAIHLWNPPKTVRTYLETGDESLRDAAWAASRDAAYAEPAAVSADAAADAADEAAWFAAFNAEGSEESAAHAAAWAAACAAAPIADSSRTASGACAAAHAAAWTGASEGTPEWYAVRAAAQAAQNVRLEKMMEQAGRQPR